MDDFSQYLSEYEKIRLDNIRRNSEFLQSLGIDSSRPTSVAPPAKTKKRDHSDSDYDDDDVPVTSKRKLKKEHVEGVRRSSRLGGVAPVPIESDELNSQSLVTDKLNSLPVVTAY